MGNKQFRGTEKASFKRKWSLEGEFSLSRIIYSILLLPDWGAIGQMAALLEPLLRTLLTTLPPPKPTARQLLRTLLRTFSKANSTLDKGVLSHDLVRVHPIFQGTLLYLENYGEWISVRAVAKRFGEGSEILVFLGEKDWRAVQIVQAKGL